MEKKFSSNASKAIDWFKLNLNNNFLVEKIKKIKLIISDVDGCLTDANIFLPLNSEELKGFSVQDGFAVTQAIKAGLQVAFLSGRGGQEVAKRAQKLGIPKELCIIGVPDEKTSKIIQMQKFLDCSKEETLLFGDDYIDYQSKDAIGLFATPANAPFYIQQGSDWIVPFSGGENSFRLLIDLILYIQTKHFASDLIEAVLKQ